MRPELAGVAFFIINRKSVQIYMIGIMVRFDQVLRAFPNYEPCALYGLYIILSSLQFIVDLKIRVEF